MLDYCRFRDINDFFANGHPEKARRLLMEIQSRCIALRDEVNMLKLRLQAAEDALYLSQNLFKEGEFYWLKSPHMRQGPYCPHCYENESALIHLERASAVYICPYCQSIWQIASPPPKSSENIGCARILRFAP